MKCDVTVIGGGAAGLMCAIEAGKRGRTVTVLERNDTVGKKIRISGGGRCNFTNLYTTADNFISRNPNFAKSALARHTPADFIALVRKHGIAFHEKKLGQLFCDGTSDAIIQLLLQECREAGVQVRTGCNVSEVSKPGTFSLSTNQGMMSCESLVIASGGLSIPKIGASRFGYDIATQFGLNIVETRAALVPLVFGGIELRVFRDLSGVSVEAAVSAGHASFRENVLFTHHGLSGPAILQISTYWKPGESLLVDLFPSEGPETTITPATIRQRLPSRFAKKWIELHAPVKPEAQWTRTEIDAFSRQTRQWKLMPSGTGGYSKAEVTLGGVDTADLSSKTMESRQVPGLYFIGEVVDVTGQLGGFNFQWAWASAFVAGQFV